MPAAQRYPKVFNMVKILLLLSLLFSFLGCVRIPEYTREELEQIAVAGPEELLERTLSKPWQGEAFVPGVSGGTWYTSVSEEPKSFNLLIAERDANTYAIVSSMHNYLVSYDVFHREWNPNCAYPEIAVDEEAGTLSIIYTLRENLYWSFYNSDRKVPVTSDDVIFWYDEIEGDPVFNSSAYNSRFVTMEDGSTARISIEKIDERSFAFRFPRIVADPLLSTNMNFGPRFIYQKAKEENGSQGVLALFSIASDPKEIPSMGPWFLTEYVPGLRMVFRRNNDYWEKDSAGGQLPHYVEKFVQILADSTSFLLFKDGRLDAYSTRPEDLDEIIRDQGRTSPLRKKRNDYTVFNADGNIGAVLWSFNQNPKHAAKPQYDWFTKKEFRQAMSCLLNRDRIITQVFRGLAEPKLDFFPPPNPYYNPDIQLRYVYNPQKALELFRSIGIKQDAAGIMRDEKGNAIEFDLAVPSDTAGYSDISLIIMDEAAKIGIKINIRPTDFQKMVEQLSATYDWESIMIGLGTNFFPTQGSNVWPSDGALHIWYPLQKEPATEWEARIDYLYNEGKFTLDRDKAQKIWDEYQEILLEQCPVIYLVRGRSFFALQNRWDFTNFYYDSLRRLLGDSLNREETAQLFLR